MARSTRSRRTTIKTEAAENPDTTSQDVDTSEKSEKKSRRGRKQETKDLEQKEENPRPKENTPDSDEQNVQSEVTDKSRRGRKKREDEPEDNHRSSSTKRSRSRRTPKDDSEEQAGGDVATGSRDQRQENNEQITRNRGTSGSSSSNRVQQHRQTEEKAEEKDSKSGHRPSSEERHDKQVAKIDAAVTSLKSAPQESQKVLRMDVEEEKLDFEIEDELQLKVQHDEVLDGDDEEAKEDDESSRTNDLPCSEYTMNTKGDEFAKDSKGLVSSEKLVALDEMLKRRASRRNNWQSEKEGGPDKDKENQKGAARDRWGKLAEKNPSKEHAQTIVTTDSLKELSKELEAKVVKKEAADAKDSSINEETKGVLANEEGKWASAESKYQSEEVSVDSKEASSNDPELEDRRRARHISMNDATDDNNGKDALKESGQHSDKAKLPSAGLALGSTNWAGLEATRRKARDAATPPRSSVARHLLVLNLVRPFTLGQLTDLVTHSGVRPISDLWLDRIKSKAIVEFVDESASQEAREELHNIVWPKGSPKTIKCEFLTEEEVKQTKAGGVSTSQRESPQNAGKDKSKKESPKERTRVVVGPSEDSRGNGDLRRTIEVQKTKAGEESRRRKCTADEESQPAPAKKIREWDLPKLKQQQHQQTQGPRQQPNLEEPATTKRLEDLFRKTNATPNIYWIPLPENEAIERAKIRAEKQKEDDRRNRNRRLIN
ncbi:hypothetical protein BIW11_03424 [Tropilaelaps mercedesae]|uniref:RRM domain-containing protein n=1 Tax=Tropilaelaps mercedesae TaxID=418985 RepID=A0A1V9XLR8_9ACAR|nr:hypothetical protein BIW11_03424 [Tropilaelaps mercedesae]